MADLSSKESKLRSSLALIVFTVTVTWIIGLLHGNPLSDMVGFSLLLLIIIMAANVVVLVFSPGTARSPQESSMARWNLSADTATSFYFVAMFSAAIWLSSYLIPSWALAIGILLLLTFVGFLLSARSRYLPTWSSHYKTLGPLSADPVAPLERGLAGAGLRPVPVRPDIPSHSPDCAAFDLSNGLRVTVVWKNGIYAIHIGPIRLANRKDVATVQGAIDGILAGLPT